ncbi:MAG: ECF transporter S component [Halanaerobiaceae bacterium]|nr:ECF transporter S component [Halanaerobiaceae bacterium]
MEESKNMLRKNMIDVKKMVKISLLIALAFLLTYVRMPLFFLPFFPQYLKLDIAELPALIAGFLYGPVSGVLVVFVRNVLDALAKTDTGGIGELSNFIVGSSFVLTASIIYKLDKSKKGAFRGVVFGTLVMAAIAVFSNKYVILPLYGIPAEWKFVFSFILPFNLLKGTVNSIVVFLIYKKISILLKSI